ncbi:MAG: HAD-IA family hydrolase [Candidatus Lokiarchaeota archaeon]|nr:HAD-IA family hydrolase [Candidatus Lokiarchaeota archaeon]
MGPKWYLSWQRWLVFKDSIFLPEIRLSEFEAVVFDLDSTLTDTSSYPYKASLWILKQSSENYEDIIKEYIPRLVKNYQLELKRISDGEEYKSPFHCVRDATIATLKEYDIHPKPSILKKGIEQFKSFHVKYSQLQPGTKQVLDALKKLKLRLGIITNSWEGHAPIILEKLSIASYFDSIIDPGTVKAYKPMGQIFQRVLSDLDVAAEDTVFVGDEFYADIVGAGRFGLRTIWINQHDRLLKEFLDIYGSSFHPDVVIKDISELLEFL